MFRMIKRAIKNPKKVVRYFLLMIKFSFFEKRGTLFFLGMDSSGVFGLIFRGYESCYCFEPNPERFRRLHKKYNKYPHVHLFNVAVAQHNGEIEFNISNNNGASSSIGNFHKEWDGFKSGNVEMIKSIRVPCINLLDFCKQHSIGHIEDYISDIQGMDLEVLKTMKPMIEDKKIRTITCEVTKDGMHNIYSDLPSNSESGFFDLLRNNYELIGRGSGFLGNDQMDCVHESSWEMDCKWVVKGNWKNIPS